MLRVGSANTAHILEDLPRGCSCNVELCHTMKKALCVLSGGLDSAVNLAWGATEFHLVEAITFNYGQRAAKQEAAKSKLLCAHYNIPHRGIKLPFLAPWTESPLVNRQRALPALSATTLDNRKKTAASAKAVWVPNRNGVFLNVAASRAESLGASILLVGFNKEEGATFPDNSKAFIQAINKSFFYSTLNHVIVRCRTTSLMKTEIVKLGLKLALPFQHLWSCYEGGKTMCGLCESCLRLKRALKNAAPALLETLDFAH